MKKLYSLILLGIFALSIGALLGSSNKQPKKPMPNPSQSERTVEK